LAQKQNKNDKESSLSSNNFQDLNKRKSTEKENIGLSPFL
jgi:hypothetical protein